MFCGVNMEGSLRGRDVRKLNTQGYCFLCLKPNKTTSENSGETDVTKPELIRQQMSIRCLTRYLQVNLDEMEQATSSAGMSTTGSKPEVDVEVDLCECCEKPAGRFSSLFQQLERIQTELKYYLGEICYTVLRSSKTPELVRNFSREMTSHIDSLSQLVLVNKLRNEIREKGLKTRRTLTVSLKKNERLPKEEVPDPVEDVECADFDKQTFSSMENYAVQDSVSNFDQRSGIKQEPEDSSVISPKKYLKQSMKEKSHRSEVEFRKAISKLIKTKNIDIEFEDFAENVDDTGVCLPDLRVSPTSSPRPTEDNQEDLKLGFTDNETLSQSLKSPVKQSKKGKYYTKDLHTGMYECKQCYKKSKYRYTIVRHFKSDHLKPLAKQVPKYYTKDVHTGMYGCNKCDKKSKYRYTIVRHFKSGVCLPDLRASTTSSPRPTEDHQEDLNLGCRDNETPSFMPPVKVKPKESMYYTKNLSTEMYKCNKCNKESIYRSTINDHYNRIHLKRKFKCDICNVSAFGRPGDLKVHKETCAQKLVMKLAKEKDPKFKFICKVCGKRFDENSKLLRHTRLVHKNVDRYKCDLCDKKYTSMHMLKNHQAVIHQSRKLYCKICNKMYKYRDKLQKHEKQCEDMAKIKVEFVGGD